MALGKRRAARLAEDETSNNGTERRNAKAPRTIVQQHSTVHKQKTAEMEQETQTTAKLGRSLQAATSMMQNMQEKEKFRVEFKEIIETGKGELEEALIECVKTRNDQDDVYNALIRLVDENAPEIRQEVVRLKKHIEDGDSEGLSSEQRALCESGPEVIGIYSLTHTAEGLLASSKSLLNYYKELNASNKSSRHEALVAMSKQLEADRQRAEDIMQAGKVATLMRLQRMLPKRSMTASSATIQPLSSQDEGARGMLDTRGPVSKALAETFTDVTRGIAQMSRNIPKI